MALEIPQKWASSTSKQEPPRESRLREQFSIAAYKIAIKATTVSDLSWSYAETAKYQFI